MISIDYIDCIGWIIIISFDIFLFRECDERDYNE